MAIVSVTYLEMLSKEALRPKHCTDPAFEVREAEVKQWAFNCFLYQWVGGPWQWTDKLKWTAEEWQAYAEAETLRTFVGYYRGSPAGYFELNFAMPGEVEISYFGLGPAFIGRQLGGPLLTSALEIAWATEPRRVWVHTCTKDHPHALANYQARGLKIYHVDHVAL